jgi:type IV secretion system protein TrbL
MQPSATTQSLQNIIQGVLAGHAQMGGPAAYLMWSLVTIEIVLLGIWFAFGDAEISKLLKKVLEIGIWIWIVQAFPTLAQSLVEGMATAALRAGGGGDDFRTLQDPSGIMSRGLVVTQPLVDFIGTIPKLNVADKIIYYLCALAIVWMYIWMGWCLFYPMIEYYIFVVVGSVLIPFAINRHTRFIADKAINMVVGCGLKLMVLAFCLAIIQPVLAQIKFTTPITWNQLFSVMLQVGALGYLLYKAPQAAMSMVQSSPTLNGGEILSGIGRAGFSMIASTSSSMYRAAVQGATGGQHNSALGGHTGGGSGGATGIGAAAATAASGAHLTAPTNPSTQKGHEA